MPEWTIIQADVIEGLRALPDGCVQTAVTSPPYYGLRDYGTASWDGGDPNCDHAESELRKGVNLAQSHVNTRGGAKKIADTGWIQYKQICGKCGAIRQDQQLGLESNPDCLGWATGQPCGECYICHMVAVFAEVWRVLRDDGTVWLNIGDSYAGSWGGYGAREGKQRPKSVEQIPRQAYSAEEYKQKAPPTAHIPAGMKPKDMMMIPARLALALQASGWYVRSDIIWAKKNGMPESVTDRPTKAYEHIFLLAKNPRYYFDHEAIKVKSTGQDGAAADFARETKDHLLPGQSAVQHRTDRKPTEATGKSNARDYWGRIDVPDDPIWELATKPFKDAHFATFPLAIPARCIKAGTSEKGQCPTCGTPWRRVVEKRQQPRDSAKTDSAYPEGTTGKRLSLLRQAARANGSEYQNETRTVGWQPGCECGGDPIPQLVLDPFCGAATTGLMAHRLGRRFHGIELNPEYVAMGRQRILADQGAQPEQLTEDDRGIQLRFDL